MAAKFAFNNLVTAAGVVIVPSSELASHPSGNLLKPGASVRLRFPGPWVIVADGNDQIPFLRGGSLTATVSPGIYATPAALASAIVAALEASDPTPVWACSYTGNKFTISTAAHAFDLQFASVTDGTIGPDIGFAEVDVIGGLSHTAGSVAYQSRHAINVDLGSAQSFTTAIVRGHNMITGGVVTFQADTSTMVGRGLSDTSGAFLFQAVLAGTDPRSATFASQSKRYLRLIINDVSNPVGFTELGVWFVGTYGQPTVLPAVAYSMDREHLSSIAYADGGAHQAVPRARRRVYKLSFQLEERGGLAVADRALFDSLDALGIGTSFFMILDVVNDAPITVYGFIRVGLGEAYTQGTFWAVSLEFVESLG